MKDIFIREAISLAENSIDDGGGPFGAVIVKDGVVVGRGNNVVTLSNDPTAHAEIVAIRDACSRLGTFDLSGCEIYSSCEPCPMCLGAIYWARLGEVFYSATREDANSVGFDDSFIYEEFAREINERRLKIVQILGEEGKKVFVKWDKFFGKIPY